MIASKKNSFMEGGKRWHITPDGRRMLPLGSKTNWFTNCMSKGLKGNLNTGKDLTPTQLQANKDKFKSVLDSCKLKKPGTPKKVGRPPKA